MLGRGPLIDVLYKKVSRPKLVQPVFVTSHPIDLSPLARRNDDAPGVTDRFQLVVNGWEIVNAYSELVDPIDQRRRFEEQIGGARRGRRRGDGDRRGLPRVHGARGCRPMSGFGMGIDRLVCLLSGQDSLRDAVLFPLMKPLGHDAAARAARGARRRAVADPAPAPPAPAAPDVPPRPRRAPASPPGPADAVASEVKPEFAALLGYPVDDVKDVGIPPARARALFDEWVTTPEPAAPDGDDRGRHGGAGAPAGPDGGRVADRSGCSTTSTTTA